MFESFVYVHSRPLRDRRGVWPTRVQVVAVDIGAAVAAADAAEGGDGVSVAVAVAEKGKKKNQEICFRNSLLGIFSRPLFATCTSLCC